MSSTLLHTATLALVAPLETVSIFTVLRAPPPLLPPAPAAAVVANTDSYAWSATYGGAWPTAADWLDVTTGLVAAAAPTVTNPVSVTGGTAGFTNVTGSGSAASLSIANDVVLWGSLAVAGVVSLGAPPAATPGAAPNLQLDGGASLAAASLSIDDGTLEAGDASTVAVTGTAHVNQAFLAALAGSSIRLGGLVEDNIYNTGNAYQTPLIAVDATSSVHVGANTASAAGALTIDAGHVATASGAIDANVVLNGTLAVQAGGTLAVNGVNPFATSTAVSGAGTLVINEASTMVLAVADSAAINFAAPDGTLVVPTAPTGSIIGFTTGDVIEIPVSSTGSSVATGLTYQALTVGSGRVTLTKGGFVTGTLAVSGSFTGLSFHLSVDAQGDDFVTVQAIGTQPVQPAVIAGSAGSDVLFATANGQALTGYGGADMLEAHGFTGIVFKDTTADLNGDTVTGFTAGDTIDLTDLRSATAAVTYNAATGYQITSGTLAAALGIVFSGAQPVGSFAVSSDGASGTDLKYVAANTDALLFVPSVVGSIGLAANWSDTTTGTVSALAPGCGNAINIVGGSGFTSVLGNGAAASVQASGDVLLRGSLNVGSVVTGVSGALAQTGTLALVAGSSLVLAGTASLGGMLEVGAGAAVTAAALGFSAYGAAVLATGGGSAGFAQATTGSAVPAVIGVDALSLIELGSAGGAATGALTIDSGATATVRGTIEGNVVVNGTLAVGLGGSLAVTGFGAAAGTVSGGGALAIGSGATLALTAGDSAAIVFSPLTASASAPGTLVLSGPLPSGTIQAFAAGDQITLARAVTGVAWTQAGSAAGSLALINNTTTVGTITLAGTFQAGQFLVTPSPSGLSTTLTYLPAPATASGNTASANNDPYAWAAVSGGNWNNPALWIDGANGYTPSVAPGAGNAVTITGGPGGLGSAQIISGSGLAASVILTNDAVFTGTLAVAGVFEVEGVRAEAWIAAGATLQSGALADQTAMVVTGAATVLATGTGGLNAVTGALTVTGGSAVWLEGGGLNMSGGTIAVDTASSIEVGAAGGPAAGALTIDSGQTVYAYGGALLDASLVLNGGLALANGSVTIAGFGGGTATVRGAGTIALQNETLLLNAADSAPIAFASTGSTLQLAGPLPTGTITGFTAGDTIVVGQPVTGASFVQASATQGTLTLTDGGVRVGSLTLGGNFAGGLFQLDVAMATGVATLSEQVAPAAAGTASAVSTSKDAYAWAGPSGGSMNSAVDWLDTTAGHAPTTAPGASNAVAIAGTFQPGGYATVAGTVSVASLAVTGNVLLTGQATASGAFSLALASGAGALALAAGAKLTAASATVTGRLQASAGTVTVGGRATLGGATLLALNGAVMQLGGIVGSTGGNIFAVDANSMIKVGSVPSPATGALSVGSGAYLGMAGSIFGNVAVAGAIVVPAGGALLIDMNNAVVSDPYGAAPAVTGSGTLTICQNGTLGLGATDSAAIAFAGPGATLALAGPPSGVISGFAIGDQIQVGEAVTGLSYSATGQTGGLLTLLNGTATMGTLQFAGSIGTSAAFQLFPGAAGNSATITLQSLGPVPAAPTLIRGSLARDNLVATAPGQTITGLGGGDTLDSAGLAGITFLDTTANQNASAVLDFVSTDSMDFTDMIPSSASLKYSAGKLGATDGQHSANLALSFVSTPASGSFHAAPDGSGGTKVTWY